MFKRFGRITDLIRRITTPQQFIAAIPNPAEIASRIYGMSQDPDPNRMLDHYCRWVAIAANRNATAVSSVPLRVYRKVNPGSTMRGKRVSRKDVKAMLPHLGLEARKAINPDEELEQIEDEGHPYVELLNNPNPYLSLTDLLGYWELCRSIMGDGYLIHIGSGDMVTELWPMDAQHVRIVPSTQNMIEAYLFERNKTEPKRYEASLVSHLRRVTMLDPFHGTGDFQSVVADAELSEGYTIFALRFLQNGAHPSCVASIEGATAQQLNDLERQYNNGFAGYQRAGKMMFTNAKTTISGLGNSGAGERSYLQSDTATMEIIAQAADMPVALLKLDTAALATAEAAEPWWQKFGLLPRLKRIEDCLNRSLTPKFRRPLNDESLVVAFDNVVKNQQSVDENRELQERYNNKLATLNEVRSLLGMDVMDGGDEFKEDPISVGFGGGGGFGQQEEEEPEDEAEDEDEQPKSIVKMSEAHTHTWACSHPHDHKELPEIDGVTAKLQALFKRTGVDLAALYARMPRTDPSVALGMVRFTDKLLGEVGPEMRGEFVDAYNRAVAKVQSSATGAPSRPSFDMADPRAIDFLNSYEIKFSRTVSGTVEEKIRVQLADAYTTDEGLREVSQRVYDTMEGLSGYDAERIARTEMQRASSHGQESGWESLGGAIVGKRWLLSGNPCPLCVEMERKFGGENYIPLGKNFIDRGGSISAGGTTYVMDYSDVQGPPAHPNCSCQVDPVFADEA